MEAVYLEPYHYSWEKKDIREEICIEKGITSIESCAFWSLPFLKRIIIPTTVQEIEIWAIVNCWSLKEVVFLGTEKQWKKIKRPRSNGWYHNSGKPKIIFTEN